VVESALGPTPAHLAPGFWQFISPPAQYGLTMTRKDERRNLMAATEAALAYLRELRRCSGLTSRSLPSTWAAAAQEIAAQAAAITAAVLVPDPALPSDPAAKTILDPGRYGFHLRPGDIFQAQPSDASLTSPATPLLAVAQAANTSVKIIRT
jgi:hypothetical protein